jgi:hypothetical protein
MCKQGAKHLGPNPSGQRHRVFHEALQHANPETGLVRVTALGRTFVIIGTRAAQAAFLKQLPFAPRSPLVASMFSLMVRPGVWDLDL